MESLDSRTSIILCTSPALMYTAIRHSSNGYCVTISRRDIIEWRPRRNRNHELSSYWLLDAIQKPLLSVAAPKPSVTEGSLEHLDGKWENPNRRRLLLFSQKVPISVVCLWRSESWPREFNVLYRERWIHDACLDDCLNHGLQSCRLQNSQCNFTLSTERNQRRWASTLVESTICDHFVGCAPCD